LQGKTRKEAARQLGQTEETLSSQLSRARALLAKRLARHGLALSGGSLAAALGPETASAAVPASLIHTTVQAASLFAAGQAAATGALSAQTIAITEGVLKANQAIKRLGLTWPQVFVPADEKARELWHEASGIHGLPRLLLLDRRGILRADCGPGELAGEITKLLEE
jgi:hypothetical protein